MAEGEGPVRDLLRGIDRHEDSVLPELQELAAGLSSALRREAWQEVDQIWEGAQAIVDEQHRQGLPLRLPSLLVEQYIRAKNLQQAQPLVQMAVGLRRQGKFVEADTLLAEAVKLDPDNAVILAEREHCSQGVVKLISVQELLGKGQVAIDELLAGLEEVAALERLAPEGDQVRQVTGGLRRIRDEMVERLFHRAGQVLEEVERRSELSEKWSLCGEASRQVEDLQRLAPERRDAVEIGEKIERLTGQIGRAQELVEGVSGVLERARVGEVLLPIQGGRLVADLKDAQAVAPADLRIRGVGSRIAEAISLSLSSPEYLLCEPEQFDLAKFYSAKELVRLLDECPGNQGMSTVEGYRHALVTRGSQAVIARLERSLMEGSAAAHALVEEALQLALAMASLPGLESLEAISDLAERVTAQVRRWVNARFLAADSLEDIARAADDVVDLLVYLRSLPGTSAESPAELESELIASIQQAIRRQIGLPVLHGLTRSEARTRVEKARRLVMVLLPTVFQRLGRPERARSVALLEDLVLAEEQIARRQSSRWLLGRVAPGLGIASGVAVLFLIGGIIVRALWPTAQIPGPQPLVFRPEPSLEGVAGYDCDYVDGHNVCDVSFGPQFKRFYRPDGVRLWLGPPISGQLRDVVDVEYFQFGRLEHHPGNPPPHDYQLGLLGEALARRREPSDPALKAALAPVTSDPIRGRYYSEVAHHIGDRNGFLRFFDANGEVFAFGYPISEEFSSDGKVIQYFQRARIEGRAGDPSSVRFAEVGIEYFREVLGGKLCHRLLNNLGDCP